MYVKIHSVVSCVVRFLHFIECVCVHVCTLVCVCVYKNTQTIRARLKRGRCRHLLWNSMWEDDEVASRKVKSPGRRQVAQISNVTRARTQRRTWISGARISTWPLACPRVAGLPKWGRREKIMLPSRLN